MKRTKAYIRLIIFVTLALIVFWVYASIYEMIYNERLLPWDPYMFCGATTANSLPTTVQVGLYEEFPSQERLAKLREIDFPVKLAIAAPSREKFLALRDEILREYPMVQEVDYWPTIPVTAGYYTGSWSNYHEVEKAADSTAGLPVMWDLEMPLGLEAKDLWIINWWHNRQTISHWLTNRKEPVNIWRNHTSMGLSPLFLRIIGMQFDPRSYSSVLLHLNFYETGNGLPADQMERRLRCGVETYGEKFVPSLGVLNDDLGPDTDFIPETTLQRDITLARKAGVSEVWLFGVNGLNSNIVRMLHNTLPLDHR